MIPKSVAASRVRDIWKQELSVKSAFPSQNICISSSRSTVIGTRCQILSFHVISKTF